MQYYIILIILIVCLYLWLERILSRDLLQTKNNYEQIQSRYLELVTQNQKIKSENLLLRSKADETIALYDITKDIYRSLEENIIFAFFKEEMNRYVKLADCNLLKSDVDLSGYTDYTILPLKVDNTSLGYLVVRGLDEQDKDKFHILTQQFILGLKRAMLYKKIQELAIRDNLTQVFTRRYCLEVLNEEMKRSQKFKYDFSILMADIDHFKEYNDRYGHLVGDVILREISRVTKESMRQIDSIGRYGGEEFLIILAETDKEQAKFAAERIRQAVETKHIKAYDEELKLTISIGIATFPEDAKDNQELIEKADSALYQAKQTGRNKVCTC
jgi:diguanylate cyclase (GGDEF)-like protein